MANEAFGNVTSAVDIFVKDMGLVLDAARDARFSAPLASAAYTLSSASAATGWGDGTIGRDVQLLDRTVRRRAAAPRPEMIR